MMSASLVHAQNASSSYESEAFGYIDEGKAAEARGDFASACRLYGQAWGKFDWAHDALIEESKTRVSRDAYGNVTQDSGLQSNLSIASKNSSLAYDLKAAACAKSNQAQKVPQNGNLKTALELHDVAQGQYKTGNLTAACNTLQMSAAFFQLAKRDYTATHEVNNAKTINDAMIETGVKIPEKMSCPKFDPETTAYFTLQKTWEYDQVGNKAFDVATKAYLRDDNVEACRSYKDAVSAYTQAMEWNNKQKTSYGNLALLPKAIDEYTANYIKMINTGKSSANINCAKVPKETKPLAQITPQLPFKAETQHMNFAATLSQSDTNRSDLTMGIYANLNDHLTTVWGR